MTNNDYTQKLARLKEIEELVKNPESSLDKIDEIIDEAKRIKTDCLRYVRGLKEKVALLDEDSIEDEPEVDDNADSSAREQTNKNVPEIPKNLFTNEHSETDDDLPF